MARLHDQLYDDGYRGHNLEILLIRVLFCLFADDTGIFEKDIFKDFIENRTSIDGSDLGARLAEIFQVLDTEEDNRHSNLDEQLSYFPYINGKLFSENIPIASFNSDMRKALLDCCYFEWSQISPAIFGSMFQGVMDPEQRHNFGAHYTSEKNILKIINPLFLNDLENEFKKAKSSSRKLKIFLDKLASLKFLDPGTGCGNFLVISYKEIRKLELKALKRYFDLKGEQPDINLYCRVNIDQMYGIEFEEHPARIAEVALWLTDHQMNMMVSEEFGEYYARLPLRTSANIYIENALRIDWEDIISPHEVDFILGNPPFVSKQNRNNEQDEDMDIIFAGQSGYKTLDYVSCWFVKAMRFIEDSDIKVGFVSTNSITQGEQVASLWPLLFELGINIFFAHKTFKWTNQATNQASVYVVIIGFSNKEEAKKQLFDYEHPKSDPSEISVKNINPYLIDYDNLLITKRSNPISNVPEISFGNMPND